MNAGILEEIDEQGLAGSAVANNDAVTATGIICGPTVLNCPIISLQVCFTVDMPEFQGCS